MFLKKSHLLAIAVMLFLQTGVQAQVENDIPEEFAFQQVLPVNNPIALDGQITDDEWGHANEIEDPPFYVPKGEGAAGSLVTFEPHNGGSWEGDADFSTTTKFLYDSESLYISFAVVDDYHENAANSPWNGDAAQMMIANADRDSQVALYNFALGGAEADADFFPICGPDLGEDGLCIVQEEAGPGGGPDHVNAAIVRSDGITSYEIRLSASALGFENDALEFGNQIGFGVAINDGDFDSPGQSGWGGLGAHAIVFGKSPSETAVLVLDEEIIVENPPCDFNADNSCDIADLDELLYTGLTSGDLKYDLDGSGTVDTGDRDAFLSAEFGTVPGDFDLDGKVVATDLNILGGNWQAEGLTSYSQGDANGDGVANATDLNAVGSNWQVGAAAPLAASAVPEPNSGMLVVVSLMGLLLRRKR